MPESRDQQAPRTKKGQFPKGVSGNPGGRTPGLKACLAAIEAKRDPEKITAALDEFYRRHMEDGDNEAGKVWLAYQVGPPKEPEIDLSDAPEAVLKYHAEQRN